jgi:hypothetical protein
MSEKIQSFEATAYDKLWELEGYRLSRLLNTVPSVGDTVN